MWSRLDTFEDMAPPPPPGNDPVSVDESEIRLEQLIGTDAERRGGLETAQHVLGHAKPSMTALYAHGAEAAAIEYAAKYG